MKHKLLLDIPEEFETERLSIRRYAKGDGEKVLELFDRNNNRELLKEHVDEASDIKSQDDAEIDSRKHAAEWESRERFVMGIWLKKTEEYVGQLWIEPKKWKVPSFELGYFLDTGLHGEGFASEAAQGSLDFIFTHLNAHRVTIITHDDNEKSWKLAERLGFKREGHIRECGIQDNKRYGVYYYGMLRSEYQS